MSSSPCLGRVPLALALLLVGAVAAMPAAAENCDGGTEGWVPCGFPASPVTAALWSTLEPTDVGSLPDNRDTTEYDQASGAGFFSSTNTYWMAVDAENGYIFAAIHNGIEIWNATASPGNPTRMAHVWNIHSGGIPIFYQNLEVKFYFFDIDAPPGNDDVVATALIEGSGLVLWDTSNKTSPTVLYQDAGRQGSYKHSYDLWATTIGNQDYAFMGVGAATSDDKGVWVYNMSAAENLSQTPCVERRPTIVNNACNGVFVTKFGSFDGSSARYIDGVNVGSDAYLATTAATTLQGGSGVRIWKVSNPAAPAMIFSGLTEAIHGVAMWHDAGQTYLATRTVQKGRIYNITSCLAAPTCTTIGAPLWEAQLLATGEALSASYSVTYSKSGATPFLYFAASNNVDDGLQREYLFDVSNPAAPDDLTPEPQVIDVDPGPDVDNRLTGYWGWYYPTNPTGSNYVGPRMGKVHGNYFYRAANSIFDIHKVSTPSPPLIGSVSANPSPALVCQPVTFTATDVTGLLPITYAWEIEDSGGAVIATGGNVNPFVWTSPSTLPSGSYRGHVTATNLFGLVEASSSAVPITSPPPLNFTAGDDAPTNDPFSAATVQFHVASVGATEWKFRFGDGTTTGWVSDPETGPNPVHTYAEVGEYSVEALIRNCTEAAITSAPLLVEIVQTEPLGVQEFQVQGCLFGFCVFETGAVLTFDQAFTGNIAAYDYDWDGDGFVDETSASPVTTHVYGTAGTYRPVLTVRDEVGDESLEHPQNITINGAVVIPDAPTDLTAVAPTLSVELAWQDNAGNEEGFHVYRGDHGGPLTLRTTLPANAESFADDLVDPFTPYAYEVRAFIGEHESTPSNVANVTTPSGPIEPLFADGLESGDFGAWDAVVTDEWVGRVPAVASA